MLRPCHLAALLLLGLPCATVQAEDEKAGTACTHTAVIGEVDEGLSVIYKGIRLGLEKAGLPRVCLEESPPDTEAAWAAFDRKWTQRGKDTEVGEGLPIVFGLGDRVVKALLTRAANLPRVFALERLAVAGRPLTPLPTITNRQALVVAQVDAERVGQVLRRMTAGAKPRIWLSTGSMPPGRLDHLKRFIAAAGATLVADGKPDAVLCLRRAGDAFADALKRARAWKVPLVSDDRARFGRGATVVFGADHEQVGRTAADLARVLWSDGWVWQPVRTLRGIRVWVDLEAADRGGVEFPLGFLATADRLRPGVRGRAK